MERLAVPMPPRPRPLPLPTTQKTHWGLVGRSEMATREAVLMTQTPR
jgi:hypothetical protein